MTSRTQQEKRLRFGDEVEVLLRETEIRGRVARLGEEISRDYLGKSPILVNILKGGVIFLADLMRRICIPHEIDFMSVTSYNSTNSTGVVRILEDLGSNIEGRHVLLVEDIVDTGRTLEYLRQTLLVRHPASLAVCTLLDKQEAREVEVPVDYVGFSIPNVFVVGYGLDFMERYRHLPYIGILKNLATGHTLPLPQD
jgi:hypoxanthine phosphoribosyltransferase